MSIDNPSNRVVHFPADANRFEFDAEVSSIFPDMASRSIPLYDEIHRLHVSLFPEFFCRGGNRIVDVGASRGRLFSAICNQLQTDPKVGPAALECTAIDISTHMLQLLSEEFPWVHCVHGDISELPDLPEKVDAICMLYVLQFIPERLKRMALRWVWRNLRKGGLLVLGQKEEMGVMHDTTYSEEYYRFRMRNGYSLEEIQAKTQALKGSMYIWSEEKLRGTLSDMGFRDFASTSRWLQFSTSVCFK